VITLFQGGIRGIPPFSALFPRVPTAFKKKMDARSTSSRKGAKTFIVHRSVSLLIAGDAVTVPVKEYHPI